MVRIGQKDGEIEPSPYNIMFRHNCNSKKFEAMLHKRRLSIIVMEPRLAQ